MLAGTLHVPVGTKCRRRPCLAGHAAWPRLCVFAGLARGQQMTVIWSACGSKLK
jgi:hypothetical protein